MNGKGDSYRPVDRKKFESRYDEIDWGLSSCSGKGCEVCKRNISQERLDNKDSKVTKEPESLHHSNERKEGAGCPGKRPQAQ